MPLGPTPGANALFSGRLLAVAVHPWWRFVAGQRFPSTVSPGERRVDQVTGVMFAAYAAGVLWLADRPVSRFRSCLSVY